MFQDSNKNSKRGGLARHTISGRARRSSSEGGQMLLEAVIALSVITIGLTAVFSLLSRSTSLNRMVSDQYVGNYLAVEGIEVVKNMIDHNVTIGDPWNKNISSDGNFQIDLNSTTLQPDAGTPLLYEPTTHNYQYGSGNITPFTRTITIKNISADEVQVNSKVRWSGLGGSNFDVNLEDYFFNWRP